MTLGPIEKCPKFPLLPGSKKPAVSGWQTYDGPVDEAAGYGIPTGARSGYWVLDLDRKGDHDGLQSISDYADGRSDGDEWADTFTVRTQNGGIHLYFNMVEGVRNAVGILDGVDVRGAGGYVVGPGSPGYLLTANRPVVDAPEWLLDLVRGKSAASERSATAAVPLASDHPEYAYRVRRARDYLEHAPICVEGAGGDAQLWTVAIHLSRTLELAIPAALTLLEPYNARCKPPWQVTDIARKLEQAQQNGTTPCGIPPEYMGVPEVLIPPADPAAIVPNVKSAAGPAYSFDVAIDVGGGTGEMTAISARDVFTAFLSGEWRGVWQKDEFKDRIVAVNPPLRLDAETVGITPADLGNIGLWFNAHGLNAKTPVIESAIRSAASACRVHPVRQYLDGLPAMAKSAAVAYFEGIAGRLWGAAEGVDRVESDSLKRFAIAAVRRVRVPGTKVDTMLIFSGEQGTFKSTFGEYLFGVDFFSDEVLDIKSKEAAISIQGMWCVEMSEMQAFKGVSEEARKSFLSRRVDKYRPPYGIGLVEHPRQTVFYGTTNHHDFLTDETGSRRYEVCQINRTISLDFDRDEFWAAANALESAGISHWKVQDPESAARHKATFHAEDAWDQKVRDWLRGKSASEGGPGYVFAVDVLTHVGQIAVGQQDAKGLHRVGRILTRICGPAKVRRFDEVTRRVYEVPPPSAPSVAS